MVIRLIGLASLMILATFASGAMAQLEPKKPLLPKIPGTREPGQPKTAEQLVKVRALTDIATIRPGQSFHVATVFDIEPGWHIYWKNSGDAGAATNVKVQAPQGFTIGNTLFPRPSIFKTEDGVSYGYESQVVLFTQVTASDAVKPGAAMLSVSANWLVCKEICLLGRASPTVQVSVGTSKPPATLPGNDGAQVDPIVTQFSSRLPQALDAVSGAEISFDGKILTVRVPTQDFSTAQFLPFSTPGVTYGEATVKSMEPEGKLMLTVPITVEPQNSLGEPLRIAGLIGLGKELTDPSYEFELPVTNAPIGGG